MARKSSAPRAGAVVEEQPEKPFGARPERSDLVARIQAARQALGLAAPDESPEEALQSAQAAAAEAYVSGLEDQVRAEETAKRKAAEREAAAEAKREKHRTELVELHMDLPPQLVYEALAVAAIRRCDLNALAIGAVEARLEKERTAEDPGRDNRKILEHNYVTQMFRYAIPRYMLEGAWEIAKRQGLTAGHVLAAAFDSEISRQRAELGSNVGLVARHQQLIRESQYSSAEYNSQKMPIGVDAEAVRRYNTAVGAYAYELRMANHQAIPHRTAVVPNAAEAAQRAANELERERAREAAEKAQAEAAKVRALIGA